MWERIATVWVIFTCFNVHASYGSNVARCAYRNSDFNLNDYENPYANLSPEQAAFQQYLLDEVKKHPLNPIVEDGFEQCDDSQGQTFCYSLSVGYDTSRLHIIKQGCWIHNNESIQDCQKRECNFKKSESSSKFINLTVNFCCCLGDKCNQVDGEADGQKQMDVDTPAKPLETTKQPHPMPSSAKDTKDDEYNYCAYKFSSSEPASQDSGLILPDGKTIRCEKNSHHCFTYWRMDVANSTMEIIFQGCWVEGKVCDSSVCVPNENNQNSLKHNNTGHFCCCSGNMCNNNITTVINVAPRTTTPEVKNQEGPVYLHDPSYKERTILISLLSVFVLALVILGVFLVWRRCNPTLHQPLNSTQAADLHSSPGFDIEDLKICCVLSRGRYSEVWKGSLNEQDVAVKIYSTNYRQYYDTEKYVYSLPHMSHENLLKFYGAEERLMADGCVQYLLVLQYIPCGTLTNFLKNDTVDWNTMCKMCHTLAKGLSHLHSDIGSADNFKPTVAHRDLNSRNVLVNSDLSCVIADLGFCMVTMGSKVIHKGHTENAEQTSLTEVGTLRYMAPEMLEGAVNLRDCEASLKQIDIYAFGLVMWEIASRCVDLYQGCPMPDYSLPFQAEIGGHPTMEEMQLLVSRNKVRPKFPEVWKEYNQAIRALKETIEECWDHDAEARLTVLCVEERIIEMKNLWTHDNRNKGITPTINTALLSHVSNSNRTGYHGNVGTQWGGIHTTGSESTSANVTGEGSSSALIINDIHESTTGMTMSEPSGTYHPPSWIHDRSGSVSTSTVETTVAATPLDAEPPHPKSQNINAVKNHAPLQPHQGRNPTVERNTHKRSDEELAVVGNNLLYGKDRVENETAQGVPSDTAVSDNIYDTLTDSLETSLMQNDLLSHHRSPPISYLQNHVHGNTSSLPPKMANNPSSGGGGGTQNVPPMNSANQRLTRSKKSKEMGILGHLALLGKLALSGGKSDSKRTVEKDNCSVPRMENGTVYESIGQHNPLFEPQHTMETEVRLSNGSAVVRPANLGVGQGQGHRSTLDSMSNSETRSHQSRPRIVSDEVGMVTLENQNKTQPCFSRLRGAPYSKSTSDLSPQKTGSYTRLQEEIKLTRPSTLSLKGHNYSHTSRHPPCGSMNSLSGYKPIPGNTLSKGHSSRKLLHFSGESRSQIKPSNVSCKRDTDPTEKIKARTKTPPMEKRGRFSLYDDRLMTEKDAKDCDVFGSAGQLEKPNISLQQFKAVEVNSSSYVAADCTC